MNYMMINRKKNKKKKKKKELKKKKKMEQKKKSFRPWDQLPDDLLLLISDLLSWNPVYLVRFGAVCKSWHDVTTKEEKYPFACRMMPLLYLAEEEEEDLDDDDDDNIIPSCCRSKSSLRRLYSHSDDKIYTIHLPEVRERKCVGSTTGGWLVTVGLDPKIQLLNPFTRVQIQLPSADNLDGYEYCGCRRTRERMRDNFIDKVCLSSSNIIPDQEAKQQLTALVIYKRGDRLAYSRLGEDHSWTSVYINNYWHGPIMDAVFYGGRLYVVGCRGHISVLDSRRHRLDHITSVPVPVPEPHPSACHPYLVESMGDLLVVIRLMKPQHYYSTETFSIYKLAKNSNSNSNSNSRRILLGWEAVTSLDNRSLFVGLNSSFSVAATEMKGCRKNCIYFTDHDFFRTSNTCGDDMGVFDLEDQTIQPHYLAKSLYTYYNSPPLWMMPHF